MNDKTHIWFVYTHTKSNGSNDDVDFLHEEVILRFRACFRVKPRMVGSRLDVICLQNCRQLFHLLARQAIDDATLASMLADEHDNLLIYLLRLWTYFIIQIRSVERTFELCSIFHPQATFDIRSHLVGSCGRQCDDRSLSYLVDGMTYFSVFWSEVVSPLRDAVCLINSIERNVDRLEKFYILLFVQRLRCHIQQLGMSINDIRLHLINSRLFER